MRYFPRLAVSASLALLSAPAAAATVTVLGDVAEVHGEIAVGDGIKVRNALARGVRMVKIHSQGGDASEAIVIARAIRDQGAHLHVAGLCASACALLVMPAARALSIDDGSVIALHAASYGAWQSAEREGVFEQQPDALAPIVQRMRAVSTGIRALLDEAGVAQEAIDFMYRLTSVSSVSLAVVPGPANEPTIRLDAGRPPLCSAWLVGPSALQAMGVMAPPWVGASRRVAALLLNESPDQLYEGLPAPFIRTEMAVSCRDLQQMMLPPERSRD